MSAPVWQILEGDALEVLVGMEAASVDAIVTDPPYGLGFRGKQWDSLPPGEVVAKELLRILKPGGHLVAFGGTRTYHRLACAIEDAGFEIRDSLMWIYGSGFPKSLNLDGDWEGWGTALKPGHEPIVLARKLLAGTVAANVAEHGCGALNVDGCRVETVDGYAENAVTQGVNTARTSWEPRQARRTFEPLTAGRWPPNVLLTHGACCGEECEPCCPVWEMDRQSGECGQQAALTGNEPRSDGMSGVVYGDGKGSWSFPLRADSGGASRFFPRFRYEAKASSRERNAGLEGLEPGAVVRSNAAQASAERGETVERSETSSGSNATYQAKNFHPTVKPVALMRWLCRLVTPPGGLILDPFLGSGTTMIAALQEGFRCVGIEREAEYVKISRRRVEEDMPLFNRGTA